MSEEMQTDQEGVETFAYRTRVASFLNIMNYACYDSKEIFLKEMITNASDALDVVRQKSIMDPSSLDTGKKLFIKIILNKNDRTLTIIDTGIGMTKDGLIYQLGHIALSITKGFMEAFRPLFCYHNPNIGQFGVGFYSSFLVADRVIVHSKNNNDEQYVWESAAGSSFTVRPDTGEPLGRGTKVVLQLKKNQEHYLEEKRIKDIVKKISPFIFYPIRLVVEKEREKEVSDDEEKEETEDDKEKPKAEDVSEDADAGTEAKDKEKKKKIVKEKYTEEEELNEAKPLWTRNPEDISQEEYGEFYKSLTNDWEDHLGVKHFSVDSVEGPYKFKAILFAPRRAKFTFFDDNMQLKSSKLYQSRVYFRRTKNSKQLFPKYLNFLNCVVDSEEQGIVISEKISRQIGFIGNWKVIRENLAKKAMELFEELTEDKENYKIFYKSFSERLKLGILQDPTNRKKLSELLRFHTSASGDEMCSLKEYVGRMKESQKRIYYITGESRYQVSNSAFVERVKKNGVEVIYLLELVDEYCMHMLEEYEGKQFVSVIKEGLAYLLRMRKLS